MMDKSFKDKILKRISEAKKLKAISNSLCEIVNLMLEGDTEFDLVYLSGRGHYIGVRIKQELGKSTAKILLVNKYKTECLLLKRFKRF